MSALADTAQGLLQVILAATHHSYLIRIGEQQKKRKSQIV